MCRFVARERCRTHYGFGWGRSESLFHLGFFPVRTELQNDTAELLQCVEGDSVFMPIGQLQRDDIAVNEAKIAQTGPHACDTLSKVGPGQSVVSVDDSDGFWPLIRMA